jgi:AraC family transcriptional regulator of adaptative response/methylated-DNA-[protein]-cysteine methyltransferase
METMLSHKDDERWRLVLARDAGADGEFYYGVSSTGVYCRPSCPSRRPDRKNVSFWDTADAAEAAGFRECRRCRPRESALHADAVGRVCRYIDMHLDETLDLATLGEVAHLSADHFQRVFKRIAGVTPRAYVEARRRHGLKDRLKGGAPITEAAFDAGYGSTSRLYEGAGDRLGMTPRAYRNGGAGMTITYATAPCELGYVLAAMTERGLCSVALGDDPAALAADLGREYPSAAISAADEMTPALDAIVRHLAGREPHLDLPTDVRATAFQQLVWESLRRIPRGETRTYEEVAASIGRPSAARAVARACATNPIALVVPCHRVVRKGGELSGYRWGVDRKRSILEREKRLSAQSEIDDLANPSKESEGKVRNCGVPAEEAG